MAVSPGPILVLCLLSFGLLNSSPLHSCPDFCTCEHFSHLNCSSAGLSLAPQNICSTVSELDLSNNQLGALTFKSKYYSLHKVWLGNNSITHLSLCVDSDVTNRERSRQRRGAGPWRRSRCLLWAPTLQLLSAERNQLQKLPQGLGQQRELRILNLSFNKISKLEPGDFAHLRQLEELHLQHNRIATLHPLTFEKLDKLKVLDLSFNLLTTLHPLTYVSLRDFGADVALQGNSWICDCSMQFLQKEMTADSNRALKTWSIECTSPLARSGMNLLELDEDELKCPDSDNSRQLYKDITVHRGARILLACSEPDAVWWTPSGQITRSQDMDGLLIRDITEQDEGLYLCMSQSHQTLSIFNVQIHEKIRKTRSASQEKPYNLKNITPRNTNNTVTQSRFALAVSLSVIITFIVAFILGVLLQPYICACWQKAKARKQKPQTTSVPNAQQEQYINEAYLHCEDVDDFEPHRERRVTFTEHTEEGNMQYYDTVAGEEQGNAAVIRPGQSSSESSDESGSEDGRRNRKNVNNLSKKVEFEHIPDSVERVSLSSQSSDSSTEGKILKRDSSTPNTSQITEERVQKTGIATIEVTQIPLESSNNIHGFSSEPFADWSPHQNGSSIMNPDLDNGDQFEFSDSVRSGSPISPSSLNGSFKAQNLLVPNVNRKIHFNSSSSSSDISDGEPTHYTVNADSEEEEAEVFEKNKATNKATVKSSSSSSDSETESRHVVETWPVVDLEHIPVVKRRMMITTPSKEAAVKNELQKEEQTLPNVDQEPPTVKKRRAPLPPPRKLSSSSSDSEDERIYENIKEQERPELPIYSKQESSMTSTDIKAQSDTSSSSESEEEQEHYYENIQQVTSPNKLPIVMVEQEPQWPVINLVKIPKVKRALDFKRITPTVDTSSSSDSEDEQLSVTVTHVQAKVPVGVPTLSKPSSGTSSSSESDDEQEHIYENVQEVISPNKLPVVMLEQEPPWPVINLAKIPKVKRSLDFKRTAPTVDTSSSSDSEDEHLSVTVTHLQGKVPVGVAHLSKLSSGTSSSSESDGEQEIKVSVNQVQTSPIKSPTATMPNQWPVINLAKVPKVKRRLDIKTTLPISKSSSSDSEDERVQVNVTQVQGKVPLTPIKVQKQDSWTSSSSESEEEQETKIVIKDNLQQTTPTAKQPTVESQWPVIDLVRIPKVKRRLDIKQKEKMPLVPESLRPTTIKIPKSESGTSSSSESEDEREIKEKQYQEKVQIVTTPNRQPSEAQWPIINLANVPKVKRRLDIKERVNLKVPLVPERVPSTSVKITKRDSGTSSSSDSEDEREPKIRDNFQQATSPIKPPTALEPNQWPVIDLVKMPKVKRRLDIKTTVSVSESSSSDSEDEKVQVNKTQVQGKLPPAPIYVQKSNSGTSSSSESEDEQNITNKQPRVESQWPVIDFLRIPKVKRRLDIKERVHAKVPPERVPSSIKVPNPDSGTSSSSESEDEREIKVKVNEENFQQTISPIKPPTTLKPHQDSQWPVINLVKIPKVKRRLDIKTTALASESSSSDSEDERVQVNVIQMQGKRPSTLVNAQKPESGTSSSSDSEEETPRDTDKSKLKTQWPILDLNSTGKLKRRLDFKVKLASPKMPSGSDSDSEKLKIKQALVQERVPPIKSPKPESGTSSSSESEDDREAREVKKGDVLLVTSPAKQPTGVSQWPVIDPIRIPKLKRRLDIKEKIQEPEIGLSTSIQVPKSDSSSSESEEEQQIKIVQTKTKQPSVESPWPVINLVRIPKLKRRLDFRERAKATVVQERVPSMNIKFPKPDSGTSSSSESDDDEWVPSKNIKSELVSRVEPQMEFPIVNTEGITRIKRRLDFKIPLQSPPPVPSSGGSQQTLAKERSSSSSSSDEEHTKSSQISVGQTARLPSQTSTGLDVKGPSRKPGLHESSSSSDDENDKSKFSSGSVQSQDKHFIKVSPLLSPTLSPTKNSQNIELEKYKVVTDDLRGTSSSSNPSPAVTTELQSKWATMNLGLSRFRKRLDITRSSNPSSPPPTSPKRDILIAGLEMPYTKNVMVSEQVATAPRQEQNVDSSSSSSESEDDSKQDGKSRVEVDFVSPQISLSSIPKVKRSLNVTTAPKKSSSSSISDVETVNMMVPDLSTGIPQVKRRLNIKAPTPPPSSSSSDDEKVYAHKFSDVTDQRSIEYKRTIMKSSSIDSQASNTQWRTSRELPYVESSTQSPKKLSLDNIKRKLLPSKPNELPPNLRWTSVGSHLSEHPVPISKRHQDGYTSPPPMSKKDSSDSSSSDDEQRKTVIVTQRTYNPRSVTFNTSPTVLNVANFEERTELRGLSALKAKSFDRKIWESETETFTESAPVSVDYPPDVYKRTVDTKTKISYAQSYSVSTSSPATEQRRLVDMLYGIPGYKRHIIKSTELPEDLPPPIPSSPLPEESSDFTWRSPQSSLSRGNVGFYNVQQQRTVEESVDEPFHDNSNISAV